MRAGGSPQHKGLRAVLGLPLIEHNLRALLWFGFERLFVAVSAGEADLQAWIGRRGRPLAESSAATLEALVEPEPLGTIGAVACLPRDIDDVVIVNVDNLTRLDLRELARHHQENRAAATIATHEHSFRIPFGALEVNGGRVVGYREKPMLPVRISSGTYVLHRRAIDRVIPGRRLDVPTLISALIAAGEAVLAFPHQEPWVDINDEEALADAQRMFSDRMGGLPGDFGQWAGRIGP